MSVVNFLQGKHPRWPILTLIALFSFIAALIVDLVNIFAFDGDDSFMLIGACLLTALGYGSLFKKASNDRRIH